MPLIAAPPVPPTPPTPPAPPSPPSPPLPTGESNLSYLEAAARGIGASMDAERFRVVVNKSTVPIGSGNLVETLVREGIAEGGNGEETPMKVDAKLGVAVPLRAGVLLERLPLRLIVLAVSLGSKRRRH